MQESTTILSSCRKTRMLSHSAPFIHAQRMNALFLSRCEFLKQSGPWALGRLWVRVFADQTFGISTCTLFSNLFTASLCFRPLPDCRGYSLQIEILEAAAIDQQSHQLKDTGDGTQFLSPESFMLGLVSILCLDGCIGIFVLSTK